jgi:hypothetical protein
VAANQLQVDNIDDVCLITNDWEAEWKIPSEQMGHPEDEEE